MKHLASILVATVTLLMGGGLRADPIYPDIVKRSRATPEVAAFFKSYLTAKSEHNIDAALGWPLYSKKGMTDIFELYMPKWPATGLSYPTRISGDFHSALIAFADTPELFGRNPHPCRGRFQGRQGGALDRLLGRSIVRR